MHHSPLSIAPMIDWSYTHFRIFMQLLAPRALLYTEMQSTGAILHNPLRALDKHALENNTALQLGGSDPDDLAKAAWQGMQHGFVEINLNLGCPSPRVQAAKFGACLMQEPQQVSTCIAAMKAAVTIPVTAKVRIGVDHQDSYEFFEDFCQMLINAGCDKLIIHARKAWLKGLSPKQNRTIPSLHYDYVYRLKKNYTDMPIIINGQIKSIADTRLHLQEVDGVMLGRLAYENPYAIALIHHDLYPQSALPSREEVIEGYKQYILKAVALDASLSSALLLKPLFNLYHGLPGASAWKQSLMLIQQTRNYHHIGNKGLV